MKFLPTMCCLAHTVPLSILRNRDYCACPHVQIGNSKKIHNDFLWGPQKIEINEKFDLEYSLSVIFNTPYFRVLNANTKSAPISIKTGNLLIQTTVLLSTHNICFG